MAGTQTSSGQNIHARCKPDGIEDDEAAASIPDGGTHIDAGRPARLERRHAHTRAAQRLSREASGQVGSERRRRADGCPLAGLSLRDDLTDERNRAARPAKAISAASTTNLTHHAPTFRAARRRRLSSASRCPGWRIPATVHPYSSAAEPYKIASPRCPRQPFSMHAQQKPGARRRPKLRRKPAHRHPSGAPFFSRKAPSLHPARPARFEFQFSRRRFGPAGALSGIAAKRFSSSPRVISCRVFARSPCVLLRARLAFRLSLCCRRPAFAPPAACAVAAPRRPCVGCAFACRPPGARAAFVPVRPCACACVALW